MPLSAYQTRVLADGALAYWPLDDAVGSVTARDLAGTRPGTIRPAVTIGVTGVRGGPTAMAFTGTAAGTSKIDVPPIPALHPGHTLEAWIYFAQGADFTSGFILSRPVFAAGGFACSMTSYSSLPSRVVCNYQPSTNVVGPWSVPYATWHHVAITYDGATVHGYVDGVLYVSSGLSFTDVSTTAAVEIGFATAFGTGLPITLQDVAIYLHPLTAPDIADHYALGLAPDLPPITGAASSAIDRALLALLAGDTTLMALTPDGVFWDEAPPHATRFVIVSLLHEADEPMFGSRAYEAAHYLVKAVMLSTAGGDIAAAADRIDTLLEGAQILATGYTPMLTARDERIRFTEVDALDDTVRWLHRGGQYLVWMSL